MNPLRTTAAVAAAVAAWHNRHPLARRVTPAQVHSVGVVAVPLALPGAKAAKGARALPLAGGEPLYLARPDRMAAWLLREAKTPATAPDDWPRRELDVEETATARADAQGLTGRQTPEVLTAAIDSEGQRLRVLIAGGAKLRIFGARAISPRRTLTAALGAGLFSAALTLALNSQWAPPAASVLAAAPAVSQALNHDEPASAPLSAPALAQAVAASAPVQGASAASAPLAHAEAGSAAAAPAASAIETKIALAPVASGAPTRRSAATAASAPAPPPPALTVDLRNPPRLLARVDSGIDPKRREFVRAHSRALRSGSDAATAATAATNAALSEVARARTVYAIATQPTPSRENAEAQMAVMRGVLTTSPTPLPTRLELMPVGRAWRVVWWPHPKREDAERLLATVRARTLHADLVVF